MDKDFAHWWETEGQYSNLSLVMLCEIAWSNGAYKATHPAKTLTDEEIWDFVNAFCTDMGDYWDLNQRNAIPMIRAILRKAQEK